MNDRPESNTADIIAKGTECAFYGKKCKLGASGQRECTVQVFINDVELFGVCLLRKMVAKSNFIAMN